MPLLGNVALTVSELEWMALTDEERRVRLKTLLADNAFGRLRDPSGDRYELTKGQIQSAVALLNKLEADKRSLEVAFKNPIEEMQDAELIATLNHVRSLLASRTVAGRTLDA
jgi:hypothetical protein